MKNSILKKIINEELVKENFIQTIKNFLTRKKPIEDMTSKQQELANEIQSAFSNIINNTSFNKQGVTKNSVDMFITINQALLILKSLSQLKQNSSFTRMKDIEISMFISRIRLKLSRLSLSLEKIHSDIKKYQHVLTSAKPESKLPGLEKLSSIHIENDVEYGSNLDDLISYIKPIHNILTTDAISASSTRVSKIIPTINDYTSLFNLFKNLYKTKKFVKQNVFFDTLLSLLKVTKSDIDELHKIIVEKQKSITKVFNERETSVQDSNKRTTDVRSHTRENPKIPDRQKAAIQKNIEDQYSNPDIFTSANKY